MNNVSFIKEIYALLNKGVPCSLDIIVAILKLKAESF
jgi:hypothetical protein